jgi:hypothetical protein
VHNEGLHNLYASPNIIRVINLRSMRLAGHVARMQVMTNPYNIFVGKPEGKILLGRCRRRVVRCGLVSSGSGQGPVTGSCEHSSEPSHCIKGGEFLD